MEIAAECANGAQTVKAVQERRPELLFLDVQMPKLDGFEVLEALGPDAAPAVIFTAAHDEHAIRAFEINALDYLLKPFSEARFKTALQRRPPANRKRPPPRAATLSMAHTERLGARAIDLLRLASALTLESELFLTADSREAQLAKAERLKVVSIASGPR